LALHAAINEAVIDLFVEVGCNWQKEDEHTGDLTADLQGSCSFGLEPENKCP